MKTKYIWGLLGNISIGISILVLTGIIAAYAGGYRIELSERKITQTGQIALSYTPKDAIALIGGEIYTSNIPLKAEQKNPGEYVIEVSKQGYKTWKKSVKLEAGQTLHYTSIVLFYDNPVIDDTTYASDDALLSQLDQEYSNSNFTIINKNELWYGDNLVTRYSTDIYKPSLYPDNQHISLITGGKFHIIDTDGSNDQALFDINEQSKYVFINNGTSVLIQDQDSVKVYHIRD